MHANMHICAEGYHMLSYVNMTSRSWGNTASHSEVDRCDLGRPYFKEPPIPYLYIYICIYIYM